MKKHVAVLKRAMTRKKSGWSSRGSQTRSGWQFSPVDDGGHSSQDQWKKPASRSKWEDVSNTVEQLETMAKDKKSTWINCCKERMKRETEVHVMEDELKATGKTDENTKATIMRGLKTSSKD